MSCWQPRMIGTRAAASVAWVASSITTVENRMELNPL